MFEEKKKINLFKMNFQILDLHGNVNCLKSQRMYCSSELYWDLLYTQRSNLPRTSFTSIMPDAPLIHFTATP